MRWQRAARWVLAALLVVIVGVVYVGLRRRTPDLRTQPVERVDRRAVQEAAAGRTVQWSNERSEVSLEFQRFLRYEDGQEKMIGITATVRGRAGRTFDVRADEGEFAQNQSAITLRGHVKVTSSDGFTVEGDEGSYSQAEGVVRIIGPVRFARGRLSGTGLGMTYDQSREVLWLLDQAEVHLAPDERGRGRLDITAASAGFARADHYARFEGRPDRRVRVVRDAQTLESDTMLAYLTPDGDRLQAVEMRGGSNIGGGRPDPGGLESMRGRDINLTYGEDGQTLERAVIAGDGAVRLAGASGGGSRRLAADWLDLGLGADGRTVASLSGRDNVVLELPAESTSPARTIRSVAADGQESAPGRGLTSVNFQERVEYREAAASGPGRVARAASMTVTTAPGFGDLESARFSGGVEFEEGTLKARAREARYDVAKGELHLAGNDERSGARPEISDERATITATRLDVQLETRLINAWTGINTTMRPVEDAAAPGRASASSSGKPGLFTDDQPTSGMADDMTYAARERRALYVGHARLWQGATTVEADKVAVDDVTGLLVATGAARTAMLVTQVNDQTKAREQVISRGSGGEFRYDDAQRLAVYTKDATRLASLVGPEGDLKAARIEIYFRPEVNEVERLEAFEAIELRLADGRVGTGARLSYFAGDQRYVLTGNPVKVVDACEAETTARTLTFFKSADRIIIDGNQERRTQTRGGAKCPGAEIKKESQAVAPPRARPDPAALMARTAQAPPGR